MYTIDQLITELEAAREDLGGDAEVRVAYQRSYPLRLGITGVRVPDSSNAEEIYDFEHSAAGQERDGTFCWLAADQPDAPENPYGPDWAWS